MNEPKRRGRPPKQQEPATDDSPAQAYARRVWDGQSGTVPINERKRRVAAALEAQGMSMEGVTLP